MPSVNPGPASNATLESGVSGRSTFRFLLLMDSGKKPSGAAQLTRLIAIGGGGGGGGGGRVVSASTVSGAVEVVVGESQLQRSQRHP